MDQNQPQQTQVTQPTTNPAPQKNYLMLGVLIVVAALLGSGATYLALQSKTQTQPQPTPIIVQQPTPTPDPIANWKTYINTQYGYSISYPNNWGVKNMGSIDPKTLELVAFNPGQVENEFSAVNIIVSSRNYEQELELLGPNALPAKVNYINATRAKHKNPDGKEYIIVLFNLKNGQNSLRIEAESQYQSIFDQMLKTFKFTNSTSTEGTFCGGIAAIECPTGYTCKLEGNYPDAGGKCTRGIND